MLVSDTIYFIFLTSLTFGILIVDHTFNLLNSISIHSQYHKFSWNPVILFTLLCDQYFLFNDPFYVITSCRNTAYIWYHEKVNGIITLLDTQQDKRIIKGQRKSYKFSAEMLENIIFISSVSHTTPTWKIISNTKSTKVSLDVSTELQLCFKNFG